VFLLVWATFHPAGKALKDKKQTITSKNEPYFAGNTVDTAIKTKKKPKWLPI